MTMQNDSHANPPLPNHGSAMRRRTISRRPRTVVHAGRLVLAEDGATTRLGRYLDREEDRELILIHRGDSTFQNVARDAGVNVVRLDDTERRSEDRVAADMAIALGAEQLEFAIDEPCLRDGLGRRVHELTAHEAKAYAAEPQTSTPIRAKLDAGCSALARGLSRVRIGHPAALDRERATIVFPDPPMAFGAELIDADDPEPAATQSGSMMVRADQKAEEPSLPPLELRRDRPGERVKRSPRTTCEIGPRTPYPFPDLPGSMAGRGRGSRDRMDRRIARRA